MSQTEDETNNAAPSPESLAALSAEEPEQGQEPKRDLEREREPKQGHIMTGTPDNPPPLRANYRTDQVTTHTPSTPEPAPLFPKPPTRKDRDNP
jgi:hypothetical protein